MQRLITLRLIVGLISALMIFAIVGVSWIRTEQAVHTQQAVHAKKAGQPAKRSEAKHKPG